MSVPDGVEKGIWSNKMIGEEKKILQIDPEDWDARYSVAINYSFWPEQFNKRPDAIKEFDSGKKKDLEPGEAEYSDQVWGVPIPNPLPAKGAKAKVTGTYSVNFTMSSGGAEADPIMGILTYGGIEYLEKAPELATLPGVKRKPPKEG